MLEDGCGCPTVFPLMGVDDKIAESVRWSFSSQAERCVCLKVGAVGDDRMETHYNRLHDEGSAYCILIVGATERTKYDSNRLFTT